MAVCIVVSETYGWLWRGHRLSRWQISGTARKAVAWSLKAKDLWWDLLSRALSPGLIEASKACLVASGALSLSRALSPGLIEAGDLLLLRSTTFDVPGLKVNVLSQEICPELGIHDFWAISVHHRPEH